MPPPFTKREPHWTEVERIRLILSTYQDGTGQQAHGDETLPGWRDFERAVAAALHGRTSENKAVFDVILSERDPPNTQYGLSCKMRRELDRIDKDGRVTIEVSNSARKFWRHLAGKRIDQANYRKQAKVVGAALIELVESWYEEASTRAGGLLDLSGSCYLVLQWNKVGVYQLFRFPLKLPDPRQLRWSYPTRRSGQNEEPGSRLVGQDTSGTRIEWYGESGAQLKYYPLVDEATWQSERFRLEPLPNTTAGLCSTAQQWLHSVGRSLPRRWLGLSFLASKRAARKSCCSTNQQYGIQAKAEAYFPELWRAACQRE